MEIVDDLTTPGCANCAVKHISSAIAHLLEAGLGRCDPDPAHEPCVLAARAVINLVEAIEGYGSHLHYAVGLLGMAEESAAALGNHFFAKEVREVRVKLIAGGPGAMTEAVDRLLDFVDDNVMALGHVREARRELPSSGIGVGNDVKGLVDSADRIRKEYFEFDEPAEKGGE